MKTLNSGTQICILKCKAFKYKEKYKYGDFMWSEDRLP